MNKTKRMVTIVTILVTLVGGSAYALNTKATTTTNIPNVSENIKSNQVDNKITSQKLDNKVTTNKNIDNKKEVTKQESITKNNEQKNEKSKEVNKKEVNKDIFSNKSSNSQTIVSNKVVKTKTTEKKPIVKKVSGKKIYNKATKHEYNNQDSEEREIRRELQRLIDEDIKNTRKNYKIIDNTPKEKKSFDVAITGVDKNGHTIVDLSKLDEYHRKNKGKH